MGSKYLKPGQDFQYPESFGFTGSARGRHDPRPHPVQKNDEYGDHLAKGGKPRFADGASTRRVAPVAPAMAIIPLTKQRCSASLRGDEGQTQPRVQKAAVEGEAQSPVQVAVGNPLAVGAL
jgi:hypothetical protein